MEPNPPTEASTSSSEDGLFTAALRKMMKKEIQEMMVNILPQVITPIVKECIREVVNEEIPSAIEKYLSGSNRINTNTVPVPNERSLRLKFLNEVSDDVLTGKEIKGEGGMPMRVAIVDDATGQVIENGPESFAKVEILFLEASENDNDLNGSHENFVRRIIKESDKTKPHFAKHIYVYLEKGIGELSNAKLANGSNWTRSCTCRLGAQVVENLGGIEVREAWTKPFKVSDSRRNLYEKRYPPSLSDEVWRLDGIGRSGERYKRLKENNILTVKDLLLFCSVYPQRLKEMILKVGATAWKEIEDHVQTCKIDDSTICVYNDSSFHHFDQTGASTSFQSPGPSFLPSGIANNTLVHQVPDPKSFAATSAHSQWGLPSFSAANHFVPGESSSLQTSYPALNTSFPHLATPGSILHCESTNPEYEKHGIPNLKDEVHRLENICKGGNIEKCLQAHGIQTVEDFLIQLLRDTEGLERIVEMEPEKWSETVNNARTCSDRRMYCYTNYQKTTAVVFNILGNVLGLYSNNQYELTTTNTFSENHENEARQLFEVARAHWEDVKHFDDEDSLMLYLDSLKTNTHTNPFDLPMANPHNTTSSNFTADFFDGMGMMAEYFSHSPGQLLGQNLSAERRPNDHAMLKPNFDQEPRVAEVGGSGGHLSLRDEPNESGDNVPPQFSLGGYDLCLIEDMGILTRVFSLLQVGECEGEVEVKQEGFPQLQVVECEGEVEVKQEPTEALLDQKGLDLNEINLELKL